MTDRRERIRARIQWFLRGDLRSGWLRPRRAMLPAATFWALLALAVLLLLEGSVYRSCTAVASCTAAFAEARAADAGALRGALAAHLLAPVLVYLFAAITTASVAPPLELQERAPRLFAPDDVQLGSVAVVHLAALLAYVAGFLGAAYTLAGQFALYVLFFPVYAGGTFVAATGLSSSFWGLPEPFGLVASIASVIALLVLLPAAEVLWLYALAHGAVWAIRTDEPTETATAPQD